MAGKVARNTEGRVVFADGANIPPQTGTMLKDQVNKSFPTRRTFERHSTRRCQEVKAYVAAGKVARNAESRVVFTDRSNIPSQTGITLKDQVDKLFPTCRTFERDLPPHVITRLFACSGPEIEVKLDIEPSVLLHATTAPEDEEDPDVAMVRVLQLALKITQENSKWSSTPFVNANGGDCITQS
ncbi:hypothetical protein AZE42_12332 [Rhizopogon vesiculosus]|uniref:Uncharacterized protein n=1 Tax=Rhizopogon vesiculosus TaxID=180088 RepID=A0A1J8PPZ9_9AGAM|nr:hypothetical protein AZE42_12332 [Rhizopogon vesiculosus]